ncbi:ATP-binding protein [Williamsia soli]|uniref:ATP-binding protein n=1 Tax=Williamsia soli TaxID=364929 RepID=UPI001A9F9ADB|nr:AAA family ATPase [Williamsia soli]
MTSTSPLEALAAARSGFSNSAHTREDVWVSHNDIHVQGLHAKAWRAIERAVADAGDSSGPSPLGVVLQGSAGSGKTHLLGQVREYVQAQDGYFIMLDLLDPSDFWRTLLSSLLDSLNRQIEPPVDKTQLHEVMRRLADLAGTTRSARRAISGDTIITPEVLDEFVNGLRKPLPALIRSHHATLRALVLTAAPNSRLNDLGIAYLENNIEEIEPADRDDWQLPPRAMPHDQTIRAISEFMAATGPSVLAIDQIDTLVAQSRSSTDASAADAYASSIIDLLAHGLMSVREVLLRTVCMVSCLPAVWTTIDTLATGTVRDRFRSNFVLEGLPDEAFARALVERRLTKALAKSTFTPPYPTWPVKDQAFTQASELNARLLIKRIDRHINDCLDNDEVVELSSLIDQPTTVIDAPHRPRKEIRDEAAAGDLDEVYQRHVRNAITAPVVDPKKEDDVVPDLLNAGLRAWAIESGSDAFEIDPVGGHFRLHARLRLTLDSDIDDEQHWAFRAISSPNAVAVQSRLRNAAIETGLDANVRRRRLFILRNIDWPGGPKTAHIVSEFAANGGQVLSLSTDDISKLSALNEMLKKMPGGLDRWLQERKPAHDIEFLSVALGDAGSEAVAPLDAVTPLAPPMEEAEPERYTPPASPTPPSAEVSAETTAEIPVIEPEQPPSPAVASTPASSSIRLGVARSGREATVELEALRKHTAIFAGSGSGKTVMIRRLIEECALQGVSAIVLDPNNDLARLGTAWPEAPSGWSGDDAAKAAEYIANVETVIWTPRRSAGRPLSFQPLPDFAAVRDDADEFDLAVDAAVSALKPYAGVGGARAKLQEAVLRESMSQYGRQSSGSFSAYVEFLADFTDDMSILTGAARLAQPMAEHLRAAMINNPMLGGEGAAVDPAVLLTPTVGKRARISVISLIGLPDEGQRQGFVNQLELALFAWIKKNPAGDKPLGGLFVMDEAQTLVPSGRVTPCTRSTVALASQARKYGLGLVFATQAPKGIDAKIVGNASTQFFGRLNSPAQIDAAAEMAAAKGTRISDIARLGTGEFYVAPDGAAFQKVNTPLCLSFHPSSPLSDEEVLALSRQ